MATDLLSTTFDGLTMLAAGGVLAGIWAQDRRRAHLGWWSFATICWSAAWIANTVLGTGAETLVVEHLLCRPLLVVGAIAFARGTARYLNRPPPHVLTGVAAVGMLLSPLVAVRADAPLFPSLVIVVLLQIMRIWVVVVLVQRPDRTLGHAALVLASLAWTALIAVRNAGLMTEIVLSGEVLRVPPHPSYALLLLTLPGGAVLTALAGVLVASAEAVRETQEPATRDPLTGALNRRGFAAAAEVELARARRSGRSVALVTMDIDLFKAINDAYGHDVGDRVIAAFAACVRAASRAGDHVARMGGEEFALFLQDTSLADAHEVAERVRVAFSTTAVPGVPETHRLTASFGVAAVHPASGVAAALQAADRGMYVAKAGGRNRVELAIDARASSAAALLAEPG